MNTSEKLEWIRALYGEPMAVFSSLLRNMIVAPKGKVLDVADYAAIEARVLFWVARHDAGITAFKEGRDLYREQAADIFGVELSAVDSFQRYVGKQAILGCGYSMGAKKFAASCMAQGQTISADLAEAAVKSYRAAHRPVVDLWANVNRAAVAAVENLGKKFTVNRTSWWVGRGFLWCQLPSGRRLAYAQPSVEYEAPQWAPRGEKRPVLYHYGVDPLSRKWVKSRTYGGKLTENVVQAIARDVMAEAMLRIEAAGPWQTVLSVHDELISERKSPGPGDTRQFCDLMALPPDWADGMPIKVEGWTSDRYKK